MTSKTDLFADYAKLKNLTGGGPDAAATFDAMAKLLSGFGRQTRIRVRLEGDQPARTFVIDIRKTKASVSKKAAEKTTEKAALEIACSYATWQERCLRWRRLPDDACACSVRRNWESRFCVTCAARVAGRNFAKRDEHE